MSSIDVTKWLLGAQEKYQFVKTLLEESKNDPPNEPYKSKYRAKEILQKIESDLEQFDAKEPDETFQVSVVTSLLNYEMALISAETEEPAEAEKHLQKAWDLVKDSTLKPDCVTLAIGILNELGILWAGRNEVTKARDYFKEAECLYGEYKFSKYPCPVEVSDLFLRKDLRRMKDDWSIFEKALTLTLYYLAQVFGHLGDTESSAKYCHITLRRQLESKDYDPLEWALNCATLSQYFIAKEKFGAARHVLACANQMIDDHEESMKKTEVKKSDDEDEKLEAFNRKKADLSRCWAKYALHVLITSRDKIITEGRGIELPSKDTKNGDVESADDFTRAYQLLKEGKVEEYEKKVTKNLVSNYEEAKDLFLFGQSHLKMAIEFYVLDDYTYDHSEIIQDHSKLFKFLIFFEKDNDLKCKMHKRRVDMLENVLKKINIQFYLSLCRQLMFELAEIYNEMMDLKYVIYNNHKQDMASHGWKKINLLVGKAVEHFQTFIDTLKDTKKQLPEIFADDVARPALIAHFYLGRLYSKFIADRKTEVENLKKGGEYYQFVIDYVEKHPEHDKYIHNELPVIKEMVELLPSKIQTIIGATVF